MPVQNLSRLTGTPSSEADTARQLRFAEHVRRQRFFQQESRWAVTPVCSHSRTLLFVPGEASDELEALTCAID